MIIINDDLWETHSAKIPCRTIFVALLYYLENNSYLCKKLYFMAKIRVRNFGPIQDNNQWIEIGKVTVFTGNQGSGKSTVAKLISTFEWIEKSLIRGDHDVRYYQRKLRFKNNFLTYHRIQNYLKDNTEIEYVGTSYKFKFSNYNLDISEISHDVDTDLPQIMYVPAERNFLTYIETFKELKVTSPSLREFRDEYKIAQKNIKGSYSLPVDNTSLEYDRQNDILHLRGKNFKVRISEASSGYQSLVPLYIVSMNLARSVREGSAQSAMTEEERDRYKKLVSEIINNDNLSVDQRTAAISALSGRFTKTAFINIVEEPEQNLFPVTQWDMLCSLLEINNMGDGNRLIMTTHSPYIINYLTLFVKAWVLCDKADSQEKRDQLNSIVPINSLIDPKKLFVYEFDGKTGTYKLLETYNGLLSDENFLNNSLADTNDRFAELLDVEDRWQ